MNLASANVHKFQEKLFAQIVQIATLVHYCRGVPSCFCPTTDHPFSILPNLILYSPARGLINFPSLVSSVPAIVTVAQYPITGVHLSGRGNVVVKPQSPNEREAGHYTALRHGGTPVRGA